MAGSFTRFSSKRTRFVLLGALALGVLGGFVSRPGVIAQEIEATPLIEQPDGTGQSFTPSAALTLTLDTAQVSFGELEAGGAMQLDDAVIVTISGSEGTAWQLACSAAPTAEHTTSAPVESLSYAPADTTDWAPFQPSPAPCLPAMSGDAAVGFDYLVQPPQAATAGNFDLVITYSVTTLE